jgi:hypothetical protein
VAELEVDGKPAGTVRAQRPAEWGVHTLRVEFRANTDEGEVLLAEVQRASNELGGVGSTSSQTAWH